MAYNKLSMFQTTITERNGNTCITYHSTCIVEFDHENIILRSGGWETVTTKRKMNQAAWQFGLGYGVHQVKGEWFVDRWHNGQWAGLKIPFVDGMQIPRYAAEHIAQLAA